MKTRLLGLTVLLVGLTLSGPVQTDAEAVKATVEVQAPDSAHPTLPETLHNYAAVTFPDYFSYSCNRGRRGGRRGRGNGSVLRDDNTPSDNPTTDEGATLGRVLFYDVNLSSNRTVSCASCHEQATGFTDSRQLSVGFDGNLTRRHSMSLTNARFYRNGRFFWDERAATLEDQVLMPIQDSVEMGLTLEELETRVSTLPYYAELFEYAFGTPTPNADLISRALAQFVRSLVSFESRYDEGRASVSNRGTEFADFTDAENRGKDLFFGRAGCSGCHASEAFISSGRGTTNNGLDEASTTDSGIFETTGRRSQTGAFKTVSLRNIGVGAPYMHDGRFATLDQVIDHYNDGVQPHPNLSRRLRGRNREPQRLRLSANDIGALVDFLHTLTDNAMLSDERFSDPFAE